MQVCKGRHKDHSEHRRSSKCPALGAASDSTGWCLSIPGAIALHPAPRTRAFYVFSLTFLSMGAPRPMRWRGAGHRWPLTANLCVSNPKQRALDAACCDGCRHQHLRKSQRKNMRDQEILLSVNLAHARCAALHVACLL